LDAAQMIDAGGKLIVGIQDDGLFCQSAATQAVRRQETGNALLDF
jgi:hypothetical protein